MSNYTHVLTIAVPSDIKNLANKIAKSLDPDVGGDKSFDLVKAKQDELEYIICDVFITSSFASQVEMILNSHEILYSIVYNDYSLRWTEEESPTLDDCINFLQKARVLLSERSSDTIDTRLANMNLNRVQPVESTN